MRIAMFMPGLGPRSLGWQGHLDFAQAMRDAGHPFAMLVTPGAGGSAAPAERRWCADAGRPTRFKPSSPSPTDAVRDGSAKLGHPVQNVTREHGLTPLPR